MNLQYLKLPAYSSFSTVFSEAFSFLVFSFYNSLNRYAYILCCYRFYNVLSAPLAKGQQGCRHGIVHLYLSVCKLFIQRSPWKLMNEFRLHVNFTGMLPGVHLYQICSINFDSFLCPRILLYCCTSSFFMSVQNVMKKKKNLHFPVTLILI